nr:hypothetical protein [Amylibacter sp.]
MNRFKKEEKALAEKSEEGFSKLVSEQTGRASKEEIYLAVRRLRMLLLEEEYSFMMDNHADQKKRAKKTPLTEDCLNLVNKKRADFGGSHFQGVNCGICDDTWQFCRD